MALNMSHFRSSLSTLLTIKSTFKQWLSYDMSEIVECDVNPEQKHFHECFNS